MVNITLLLREPWCLYRPREGGLYTNSLKLANQWIHFLLIYLLNGHEYRVLLFKIWLEVLQMSFYVSHVYFMSGENTSEFMHTLKFIIGSQLQVFIKLVK